MFILLLLLLTAPFCYGVDFSSRPTNVSLLLLHFTQTASQRSTVLGSFGLWSLMASLSYGAYKDTYTEIFRGFLLLTDKAKFNVQYKNLTNILFKVKSNGVTVSNQNYLFLDKDVLFLPDFKDMLSEDYETVVRTVDFKDTSGSAALANRVIETFSPPVKNVFYAEDFKDAAIIMSNVMFFKGYWSSPFNKSDTIREMVESSDGIRGAVNMMNKKMKIPYSHMDAMMATVMELPFGDDGKYCMLILKPDANVNTKEVYQHFERITFNDIFSKLQEDINETGLKEIDVKLPNFAKASKLHLQKPLNDLGIYSAFEPDYARFNNMVREPIYIGTVEHNAMISVTESGAIAYATTPGLNGNLYSNLQEPTVMSSLIYFIIEKPTVTVLFAGIFP